MARTKIDTRLIATGGVKRDAIASGSVEIGHLNFIATEGAPTWGGVIADDDIVALHDTSADSVRGIEAADLKSYINSGSAVAGRSGSIQFNHAGTLGGLLDWTTDGHNITGSNGRQLIFQAIGVSGSNAAIWSPAQGELKIVSHGPGSGVNSSINLIARGKGAGTPPAWINIGSASNREIEYNAGSNSSTSTHQFMAKGTHFLTLHQNAGTAHSYIQAEMPGMFFSVKEAPTSTIRTPMYLTSSMPHKQYFDSNTGNAYALVLGASDGTPLTGSALAFRSVTSSVIYDSGTPDQPVLVVKSKGASNTKGTVALDAQQLNFKIAGTNYFTMAAKSGVGIIGHGKSGVAIGTSGAFIDDDGRGSIRFDSNNSADTVTIYSGSTAIFGGRNADMQVRNATSKIYLGGGTTYYVGGAANAVGYFHTLTASNGYINSLEVDELVSRTVTRDSLEIKDNLIIAGVSGSNKSQFFGSGFQLGGVVGVEGTGSNPLFSLTLGNGVADGDSLVFNVGSQAGATMASGSDTMATMGTPGMRFGVTGSVSGSLVQAKKIEAGHVVTRGKLTAVTLTATGTSTLSTVDINGGAIDGVTIGAAAAPTVTNLGAVTTCDINGGTLSGVTVDGSLTWSAAQNLATGTTTIATCDINAGNIDGTTIGAASVAAGSFAAVAGTTGTFSGILKTDDTTAATSTTDGSLQTDGGLSVAGDAVIGDDIMLLSDAAVIHFGSDKDITLTHDADNGLRLSTLAANNGAGGLVTGSNIPSFVLHNASNSPADDDYLGGLYFSGMDDASNQKEYGSIVARAKDVTKDTTDGALLLRAAINDTETTVIDFFDTAASTITVLDGAYDFNIASHDTSNGLKLGGTLVTATAAELNIMDGCDATAAEINLLDGAVVNNVVGSKAVIYSSTGGITGSAATIGGNVTSAGTVSGSAVTAHTVTADKVVTGQLTLTSLTASGGAMLGDARGDDVAIVGGLITDLLPQNDSKVDLGSSDYQFAEAHIDAGYIDAITATGTSTLTTVDINGGNIDGTTIGAASVAAGSFAAVVGTTGTFSSTLSGSTVTTHEVTTNKLHGTGIVTQDNMQTASVLTSAILDTAVTTAKLAALSVTKAKLNSDVVINKSDANGGLTWTSGRLSVGWRKDVFVRADGSNISGSTPTHGMFATKAVATPYTTASLGAQPQSGSLMVYLNGVLLHGDHHGDELNAGRNIGEADFHLLTGSANAYKVLLNEDLALDSDDVLTVTYLSGSGTNS